MGKVFATATDPVDMPHEEYQGLIPAYAFGATDAVETRQVAEHLRHCGECRALLASYRALSDELLYTAPGSFAPADAGATWQRRLARRGRPAARTGLAGFWERGARGCVAAGHGCAAGAGAHERLLVWRLGRLEEQVAAQVAAIQRGFAGPNGNAIADDEASHAAGVVYAPGGVGWVLLCVYDMPTLPEGMAYQVWLIRDGERDSGGVFQVSPKGYGLLLSGPRAAAGRL